MSTNDAPGNQASGTEDEQFPPALGVDAAGRVHSHDAWTETVRVYAAPREIVAEFDCHVEYVAEWVEFIDETIGWEDEWHDDAQSAARETERIAAARREA